MGGGRSALALLIERRIAHDCSHGLALALGGLELARLGATRQHRNRWYSPSLLSSRLTASAAKDMPPKKRSGLTVIVLTLA